VLLLSLLLLVLAQPGLAWAAACLHAACGDPAAACCCEPAEAIEVELPSCCESEGPSFRSAQSGTAAGASGCSCELSPLSESRPLAFVECTRSDTGDHARAAALLSSQALDVHRADARELPKHGPPRWDPGRSLLARRGVIAFLAVLSVARI